MLLALGADAALRNDEGHTAAEIAAEHGCAEIAAQLGG
jgi:ankyrin repeat protein